MTAPGGRDSPATSAHAPNAAEGVDIAAALVATRPSRACITPTASGSSIPDEAAEEAKRERGLASFTTFMKFHPPTFDGEVIDSWVVESWLSTIEILLEDFYTVEWDKVHLAAHCFEKSARVW